MMNMLLRDRPSSRLAILVDHAALARRGRAIFVRAARGITAAEVNRMATHGRGLISAAMRPARAVALGLQPMATTAPGRAASPFMASVEAASCRETGISAAERALTLHILGAEDSRPEDIVTPGHIMPAVIREDAPGALELVSVALDYERHGSGADVIAWCDILDDAGEVAPAAHAVRLARQLGCPLLVRRASAAIAAEALDASQQPPTIPVLDSGLELSQFA